MTELDLDALERMEKAERQAWSAFLLASDDSALGTAWRHANEAMMDAVTRGVLGELIRLARIGKDAENPDPDPFADDCPDCTPDDTPEPPENAQNGP